MSIRLFLSLFLAIFAIQTHVNAMTTDGNQILNSEGDVVELKGINWFGFNNQSTMVDGLWGGPDSISFDFATAVYRMQLLGFNAIRLPFSFKDIYNITPRNYAQNCTVATQSQIQASVTNPSVPVPGGRTIPPQPAPPPRTAGRCNDYLPNDSTVNRFLWVINFFAKNGFYVLIDNHLREDQTVLDSPTRWVQLWTQLATSIAKDPVSKERIMIDILNEPDNFGIRWEAANGKPGLTDLYLNAMDAIHPILPEALLFVEGTGQGGIGANWGDGFATDPTLISQNGLSDPNPFFKAILSKPYINQIVISPHVYPPSVTYASSNFSGPGLWNRLSNSFGYLTQKGYCVGTNCKVFPVAIGEFGSRFTETNDLAFLRDFALYLNNTGAAADGKHRAIPHWFYWSWNPNSGDTGGVVQDDWRTVIWQKIDYLTTIGLRPWYLTDAPPPPPPGDSGTLCVSINPISGLTANQLKAVTAGSYSYTVTEFSTPFCQSVDVGNYTVRAPEIVVGNTRYTAEAVTTTVLEGQTSTVEIAYKASPIVNTGSFEIDVQVGTPWTESPGSTTYKNVVNFYIRNIGTTEVAVPWNIRIYNGGWTGVDSVWNFKLNEFVNNTIVGSTDEANVWQNLQPGGPAINLGGIVNSRTKSFVPTAVKINGVPVKINVIK